MSDVCVILWSRLQGITEKNIEKRCEGSKGVRQVNFQRITQAKGISTNKDPEAEMFLQIGGIPQCPV